MVHFEQQKIWRIATGVASLASILIFLRFPVWGMVVFCIGLAAFIPWRLSFLQRFFISILFFFAGNALVYQVFSLVHLHLPITLVGGAYVIAGIILFLRRSRVPGRHFIDRKDVICLIASVGVFAVLLYPIHVNHSPKESYAEATLHLLYSGEDNASHFAMFKYIYLHDSYSYATPPNHNGLIPTLTNYPQGSELNMAWMAKGLFGASYFSHNALLIKVYYLLAVTNFALLVYGVLLLAMTIYEKVGKRITVAGGVAAIGIGSCLFAFGPFIQLLGRGFQSQIAAYLLLVGFLYFIYVSRQQKTPVMTVLAGSLLFFGGIAADWWFLCPIAGIAILAYAYEQRATLLKYRGRLVALIVLALFGIYPVVLSLFSTQTSSLNEQGGVDAATAAAMALFLVGYGAIFLRPKLERKQFSSISIVVLAWLLFTVAVGTYQYVTIGHFSYYYYKSLYTLIPLTIVAITYVTLLFIHTLDTTLRPAQRWLLAAGVVVVFASAVVTLKPVAAAVYLHDWYNNTTPVTEFRALFHFSAETKYKDMVFFGNCSGGADYLANRWSGAIFLSEGEAHSNVDTAARTDATKKSVKLLTKYLSPKDTYVYIDTPSCVDRAIKQTIVDKGYSNNLPIASAQ
ncbi:MAG TPA: hypothetical protein VHT70_04810 [Candidatus Saccharimonadales bacterium]|jgi:hypothetical protein|nr:hypothetical protein [Candidatus Saccharimonadales bacterium]